MPLDGAGIELWQNQHMHVLDFRIHIFVCKNFTIKKKKIIVIVGIIRRKNKKQLSILKIFQIKFKFFTIIFESYSDQYMEQSLSGRYDLYFLISDSGI